MTLFLNAALLTLFIPTVNTVEAKQVGLVAIPQKETSLIETHLQAIVKNKWAEVVPGDLYHAHLILDPTVKDVREFVSLETVFSHVVAILYHSDEQLYRWRLEDGELPIHERRPRSIIGYLDGRVEPAVRLLTDVSAARDYEWYGTVNSNDLAVARPDSFAPRRFVMVHEPAGDCFINLQIDIGPQYDVRKSRQITMDCMDPVANAQP